MKSPMTIRTTTSLIIKPFRHTKWIKPENSKQSSWISLQCYKRGLTDTDYRSYRNSEPGARDNLRLINIFRDMESCWNAEQSRKKKATLTISKKAQSLIQRYCKRKSISPTELMDTISEKLELWWIINDIKRQQNNRKDVSAEIHLYVALIPHLRETLKKIKELEVTPVTSTEVTSGIKPEVKLSQTSLDSLTSKIDKSEKILENLEQFLKKIDQATNSLRL